MNSGETNKPTDEPQLRPHSYDGIQEYDQVLPNWWLFTFYIAIVWFVIHWLAYYQFRLLPTDEERLGQAMALIQAARDKEMESIDDKKLWAMSQDPKVISNGEATYKATCIACHGPDMKGKKSNAVLPGLDLTDGEWKYGNKPTEVLKIVRKGSPDITKGMLAWEGQLGVKRVVEATAFILSKHKEGEPSTIADDSPLKGKSAAAAVTPSQ
jgi:cytochrome c oxidase cbb3-type subunit 3